MRVDDRAIAERLGDLLADRVEVGPGGEVIGAELSIVTAAPGEGAGPRPLPTLYERQCPVERSRDPEVLVHRLLQLLAVWEQSDLLVADAYLVADGDDGVLVSTGLDQELIDTEARFVRDGLAVTRAPLVLGVEPPHIELTPVVAHRLPAIRGAPSTGRIRLTGLVHGGAAAESASVSALLGVLRPSVERSAQATVDAAMAIVHRVGVGLVGSRSLGAVVRELLDQ